MKRFFSAALTIILLMCLANCSDKEPSSPIIDDGTLTPEKLMGSYSISFQSGTESGNATVDLRILNDRLTFILYPDMILDSANSFDSYDPKTGRAVLEQTKQDGQREFTLYCEIIFTAADGNITVSGSCMVIQENVTIETYAISGLMFEKL